MAAKKSKSRMFGSVLIADRFSDRSTPNKHVQRNSIVEYSGIARLGEKLSTENKHITMPGDQAQESPIENHYYELINSLDYTLSIPPRVPFSAVSKGEYKEVENFVFNRWKLMHKDKVFERNIELWRQFWITCERSDTIAQIIDARDPLFFINEDIFAIYPSKKHLILCNKADLVAGQQENPAHRIGGVEMHLYSTKDRTFSFDLQGTVGLIGYPNVGKSSTINLILQQKKVKVSSTPGKTKHIQTIETPCFTLLDCPGLVFPKHTKIEQALHSILNVDQIQELNTYESYVLDRIGRQKIAAYYKISTIGDDLLHRMSVEKAWVKSKCLRCIVKDFAAGLM